MSKIYLSRLGDEAETLLNLKGALITASAPGVFATLPPGNDGDTLYADSTAATGLKWGPGGGGGGGPPTGLASGDLAGFYPSPTLAPLVGGMGRVGPLGTGALMVSQVAIAQYQSCEWEVVATNGTNKYCSTITAHIGDGTTPVHTESDVVISPPSGGTFDIAFSVDIYLGNLRLVANPSNPGWIVSFRGRRFAV